MTLLKNLTKNLSDWVPKERNTLKTSDPESGWHVHVTADRCDALACEIWELALHRPEPPEQLSLGAWAGQIAAKTPGLLGSLRVLEVDDQLQKAILRSDPPADRDGQLFYYEVTLTGTNEAILRRYQATRNGQSHREQISFVLTHETTANVVASIVA